MFAYFRCRKAAISQKMIHTIGLFLIAILLFIIIFAMTASGTEFIKNQISSYSDCFKCFSQHGLFPCIPICWMI